MSASAAATGGTDTGEKGGKDGGAEAEAVEGNEGDGTDRQSLIKTGEKKSPANKRGSSILINSASYGNLSQFVDRSTGKGDRDTAMDLTSSDLKLPEITENERAKNGDGKESTKTKKSRDKNLSLKQIWYKGRKEKWWIAPGEFVLPEKEMAAGNCGKVYKTRWRSLNIAVKTIKGKAQQAEDLQQEINIWSSTRHPNIVTFMGASYSPKYGAMLIMEFMPGGDLQNLLDKHDGPLARGRAYQIAIDIGKALCFLHGCKPPILHRDLKPPNILFDDNGVAKMADFGLSKIVATNQQAYRMTAKTGTIRYMAPEVLLGLDYSCSVDVFSFGMILSYMFTGIRPFHGFTIPKRVEHAKRHMEAKLPNNLRGPERDVVSRCVFFDPNKRITMHLATSALEALAVERSGGGCCLIA
mmetsp:Transcript_8546/g.16560  ORF Transcript_8546/g.16560 Transcript_8546/m.16560 type:complete len:412 (+) Transcript_8546:82-1317(+)